MFTNAGKAGRYVVTKTSKLFVIDYFSRLVHLFTFSIFVEYLSALEISLNIYIRFKNLDLTFIRF